MSIKNIAVLGLGNVGTLAADMLHSTKFEVTGFDSKKLESHYAFNAVQCDVSSVNTIAEILKPFDAVLSCLPFNLNNNIASVAHSLGIHYFDLTEDVATTKTIIELSKTSKGLMAPQCGLAPGFIGIVGADLAKQLSDVRSIKLRVGALPQHPTGLLGYSFNWSPAGVVNEYLNDCEVIEDGVQKWVSPMEWKEHIFINGMQLEAFTTSGGLGTMCETYLGEIQNLDYKTMRYPGHVDLMNFFFHELLMREDREAAGKILTNAKPPVDDDVVYVHASAEGQSNGRLHRKEFVRAYYPRVIAGRHSTAIAWTTAGSVCAIIEMVNNGTLPSQGFLKQEEVPLEPFMQTTNGALYAADDHNNT